ncbi:MAG: glycoside hydrolase domain-containing protein [Candidatus Zipacnadales bacterium]
MWYASILICSAVPAQEATVWVASPWQHVLKNSEPGAGRSVQLEAAANEYEPFRIIVSAGEQPLWQCEAAATDLVGPAGRIPVANLTFFREHYIHCFKPSYRSTAPPGWYPDPLIPFLDPFTGSKIEGAKYLGAPFDVEPHTNQGLWVDVYVPASTQAGEYTGSVLVTVEKTRLAEVPVQLTVWGFALPDTFAMRSNFGGLGSRLAQNFGLDVGSEEFRRIEDRTIDTLLAHRCQPSGLGNIWPTRTAEGGLDDSASGERLRMMVEDKHVNSLLLPFAYQEEPEKCKSHLRNLAGYLRERGWLDLAYVYMKDEPNNAHEYEIVRQQGALIREADPGIRRLCTEQTIPSDPTWGDLYGAVDIWCPLWGLYDEKTAKQRQALGEEIWSYTALCQGAETNPFWQIDFPPVVFRAPFWVSWHYNIRGFLYWSSIYVPPDLDPWECPHFRDAYWGEGMLLYPGREAGIDGPVTSIRLKLIREAMEDFEYMTLAANAGKREEVNAIVDGLARSFTDWARDPEAYFVARRQLAALITP